MATGKVSFRDLDAFLSVEDVYDLIEIETVNVYNRNAEIERQEALKPPSGKR